MTFDQAKPAVKYIIARLRGDLDRHFTDKKFAALFREVDSNKNGKLERNELRQLVQKFGKIKEQKYEELSLE